MNTTTQKLYLLILFFDVAYSQPASSAAHQVPDSVRAEAVNQAALLFPRLRQFSISHEENAAGRIRSKMNGDELFEGQYRSSKTKINMNMPIMQRGKNMLLSNLGVIHQFYELSDINSKLPDRPVNDHNTYIPMLSAGLTYVRTDSIFGKPITFAVNSAAVFDPSMSRSQFTFTGVATIPLIQNENTRLMGGAIVLLDPASPTPFFLMISYYHRFRNLQMDLVLDLPYRAALRKEVGKKASLSLVNELGGSNSFFEFDNPAPILPTQKLTMSSLEIKSGLQAEYRLTKKAVLSVSGGVNSMVNSRIRESNSKPKDYFLDNRHKPVPFVQVGISLLPFWKGLNL